MLWFIIVLVVVWVLYQLGRSKGPAAPTKPTQMVHVDTLENPAGANRGDSSRNRARQTTLPTGAAQPSAAAASSPMRDLPPRPATNSPAGRPDETVIDVTGRIYPLPVPSPTPLPPAPTTTTARLADFWDAPRAATPPVDDRSGYGYEEPRLGTRFRRQLKLTGAEVALLNKFWSPHTAFLAIDGCCTATIRLHLLVLASVESPLQRAGTTLARETAALQALQEQVHKAQAREQGWWVNEDGHYWHERAEADLHLTIFRRCENAVREAYGHKRKLAAEFGPGHPELEATFAERLGRVVDELIAEHQGQVPPPDAATERALNVQNTTRWKPQLEALAAGLAAGGAAAFARGVYELADLNDRNPSVEHIFFEASKLLAAHNREEALRLYLHYLDRDRRSAAINNKPLTKTIQKSLFPQPEHLARFEEIVQQFQRDGLLAPALTRLPEVYARQRRAVALDRGAIQAVQQRHAATVEKLNDYLRDEPAEVPMPAAPVPPPAGAADELVLSLPAPADAAPAGRYAAGLYLDEAQQALLVRFAADGLRLPQHEAEALAREQGLLKNQLIDSLNEQCYALLDDVLIEEDDTDYVIYPAHYQKILAA